MKKKGQLSVFGAIGAAVAGLAIALVVAFLVIQTTQEQIADTIDWTTVTNETMNAANNTLTAFSIGNLAIDLRCTAVYNDSANTDLIAAAQYTCTTKGITIVYNSTQGTPAYASYQYKARDGAYNGSVTLANATQTIPDWVPLVIIAAIGVVIIGLVAVFGRRS